MKISSGAFKDDELVNGVDHGFNRQKLKDHVSYGVGYFGRKYNRFFIPTFGWVMMMNKTLFLIIASEKKFMNRKLINKLIINFN